MKNQVAFLMQLMHRTQNNDKEMSKIVKGNNAVLMIHHNQLIVGNHL